MIPDIDMVVTFGVVLVSVLGFALGFSIGYYRARRKADTEVRHAL